MKNDNISFIHVLLVLIFLGRSFLVLFLPEVGLDFRYRKQLPVPGSAVGWGMGGSVMGPASSCKSPLRHHSCG